MTSLELAACLKREPIPVLGNGYVKYIDHLGSDESIVEAARMSTQRGFVSWEPYRRCEKCNLIWLEASSREHQPACVASGEHHIREFPRGDNGILETMYRDRHMTPFEMCELVIEVKAPIFVFREWHRHRTQSYNEMSARYIQMPDEHYVPPLGRFERKKTGNKQADSLPGTLGPRVHVSLEDMQTGIAVEQEEIYTNYEFLLEQGAPKEIARVNTPVSRLSVMRAKANLRNWLGFLSLRDHSAAQWEMQQYAKVVTQICEVLWPKTMALFDEYTRHAVTLSRTERALLHSMVLSDDEGAWSQEEQKLLTKLKGTAA